MTRAAVLMAASFQLSACDQLYGLFIEWAGLVREAPESICIFLMPPVYRSQMQQDDWTTREGQVFAREFYEVVKSALEMRVGEQGSMSERRYAILPPSPIMPTLPRCPMSGGTVSNYAPYRDCIVEWGRQRREGPDKISCGSKPGYFSAGVEIENYRDQPTIVVSAPLMNIDTRTTDHQASVIESEVPRSILPPSNRLEQIRRLASEAGDRTADAIRREVEALRNKKYR